MRITGIVVVAALANAAVADISFVQEIEVSGAGGMSMMSSSGEVLTQISGDRSRTESEFKMESRLANMLMQDTAMIVRLDEQKVWTLNPAKREYSEQTMASLREDMQRAQEAMSGGGDSALPVDDDNCEWSDPELEIDTKGEREKIADIRTRQNIITLRQSCTDKDSGNSCDITWRMETWLARRVPGEDEARAFQQQYASALGQDELLQQMQGPAQALLGMFPDNWEEVADELAELKGYPMRSIMQLGIGGEQCQTADGTPIAMSDIWANAGTSAYNAVLDRSGSEAGRAAQRSAGEAMGNGIGGSIGGAAVGAAAGEIVGGLTGMFRKKREKPKAEEVQDTAVAGQVTAFRIEMEVVEWSEDDIPAEQFAEPSDWKKVD